MQIKEIRRLTRSLSRSLVVSEKEGASCCGLPILQSHILIELGEKNGLSLNELSKQLATEKASLSRAVQALVEKGYVSRNTERKDRRAISIQLTDKGQKSVNDITKDMNRYTEEVINQFDESEIEDLMYYLKKLDNALEKVNHCTSGKCK
ncbi:MarR family transcriptional regulator [Macrococcoides goetzii]|uniref:MarR family transcriptional regulator n=1 Tax=Macrococcoides goetzii TaxID=1891097 RepID=A0A2G5NS26_9STAP|nr:MarR family transcriptional regulator [Macrococcus goetzii]RAI82936.1 MarR family transcriptional regulator [Macrococcus goetzii]